MAFPFFGVLSAAALAASGFSATSETRSAQALPAQNLAMVQTLGAAAGRVHAGSHLTDGVSDPADESNCERGGGHWDSKRMRCRKAAAWLFPGLLIGAGTAVGIGIAVSESDHHSVSN